MSRPRVRDKVGAIGALAGFVLAAGCKPSAAPVEPIAAPSPHAARFADAQAGTEPDPQPRPEAEEADKAPAPVQDHFASVPPLPQLPTGDAARVGSVKIPMAAFHAIYDLKVDKYTVRGRNIPPSADRRYRKSIVERLIYQEVLRQEAKAIKIAYDKTRLAERTVLQKRGIRDWPEHLRRRGETEDSLRAMYVAELREQAILRKRGKLAVSAKEIDTDYQKIRGNWRSGKTRVRASHILVPIEGGHEREAEAKADKIHKLAKRKGADFAKLAKEHSTGPSASQGGDIGIFTSDRMAREFSDVAFAMKRGQISKPVKTKYGWHIIKLTGKWPPGDLPKSALKDQIFRRLEQSKLHNGRRELKQRLLQRYPIVDNVAPTLGPDPRHRRP